MAVSPVTGQDLIEQEDGTFKDPLTQDVFTQEYLDEVGETNSTVERDPYADRGQDGKNYFGKPEGEGPGQPEHEPVLPEEEEAPGGASRGRARKAESTDAEDSE